MLKKTDEKDIAFIKSVAATVLTGDEISEDYSHDELSGEKAFPDVLVKASSTEEIAAIMKYCNEKLIPVVVRGSGTGLVGSSVAVNGGVMIETTAMNKILELDNENLTVTVQPGVLLMELSAFVEANKLFYPPDPGEKSATIGGNISTNAGGMRAVKYGVTRDYVKGLTAVLPTGEIITVGGKTVKNSSGYSLKDLIVGSEGTLCVITEAVLKLLPLPEKTVSLLIPFPDIKTAISTVPKIIKAKIIPTAIEFMEKGTLLFSEEYLGKKFPDTSAPAYLLLTFDGSGDLEPVYTPAAELCLENGAIDVYTVDTDERKAAVWGARGAFLEAIKASTDLMDECDVVVPRSSVAEFIFYTEQVSEQVGIRIPYFGHAGDGNLHIYICRDGKSEEEWKEKLTKAFDLLYNRAAEIGGLVSGEHGIGLAKRPYLARQTDESVLTLMRGIKKAFDPNVILNPGKIF